MENERNKKEIKQEKERERWRKEEKGRERKKDTVDSK